MMVAPRQPEHPDMNGVRGQLRERVELARYTTWKIGGFADWLFQPADKSDLCRFLAQLPSAMPVLFIGLGSNLLIRDAGFRGVVVRCHKGLSDTRLLADGLLYIESGVACAQAARFCNRNGYVGAEFLAGIPGSMGGALAMNAGAFGGETWQVVRNAEMVDNKGCLTVVNHDDLKPSYRSVDVPEDRWFVSATLRLDKGDTESGRRRISELLKKRGDSQPVQSANAGSVFKNPPGDYAARLIESAGLKGMRIGGAVVSEKHANFILNDVDATAADVENLILEIQGRVRQASGISLEPEVRIVGG